MRAGSNPELFFITPNFGRASGGVGASAERIALSLAQHCNLTLFIPDKDVPAHSYTEDRRAGRTAIRFGPGGEEKVQLQFLADLLEMKFHELRDSGKTPCRIVGFYAGGWSYAACLAAQSSGVPFSVCCRGNDVDLELFGDSAFRLSMLLQRSESVLCVTHELAHKVKCFSPASNVICIPNGCDTDEFAPARDLRIPNSSDPVVIGLFGEIKEKKGLDVLLAAFDPAVSRLRIVGSLRPEVQKLLQGQLALKPELMIAVELRPYVKSAGEMESELHAVDIVCIPSIHEGMSNVMLEAMSCGKTVVASAVGGAKDAIRNGENGYLFRPRDADDLRRALAEARAGLRSGSDTLQREARRTVAEHFSWLHEQQRYLAALITSE